MGESSGLYFQRQNLKSVLVLPIRGLHSVWREAEEGRKGPNGEAMGTGRRKQWESCWHHYCFLNEALLSSNEKV